MVLGRGRLGTSLAEATGAALLSAREWRPEALPPGVLVVLAVPDQHVADLARAVAPVLSAETALLHLSGALPLTALAPAKRRGSFHPFQSFPAPKPRTHFEGITVAVDATDAKLLEQLEELAAGLHAHPRRVTDGERTLYHAAAVTAGNYLVALAGTAAATLQEIGWSREEALAALLPLMRGTLANLEADRLPGALIGPIRRGDAATVERQLAELRRRSPAIAQTYAALGRATLALARESGLDEASAARLEALLRN